MTAIACCKSQYKRADNACLKSNHGLLRIYFRNATFICFLPQVRERNSIANLSRQIFGGSEKNKTKRLEKAFEAVCASAAKRGQEKRPKYLILDLRSDTPDNYRIRESFDLRRPFVTYQNESLPIE